MTVRGDSTTSGAARITLVGVGDWGCERLKECHPDVRALARMVAAHTDPLVLANCRADSLVCLEELRSRPERSGVEDPHSGYARLQEELAEPDLVLVLGRADDTASIELMSDVARTCMAVGEIVVPICPVSSAGEAHLWKVDQLDLSRWPALNLIVSIPDLLNADEVLAATCQSLCSIIMIPSVIGVDYADVRQVLGQPGGAFAALAMASGPNRAVHATQEAMKQLFVREWLSLARAVLVVITAGEDLTLEEFSTVGEWIQRHVSPNATVVIAVVHDKACDKTGLHKLTLMATGLGDKVGHSRNSATT